MFHHERWDGSGYLHKKGASIDLYARCVAIGDVFDALVTPRPYKEPWSLGDAKEDILAQRGKQFDPHLVDLFEEHFDEFAEVYYKYSEWTMANLKSCCRASWYAARQAAFSFKFYSSACCLKISALSVCSHGRSTSVLPKWP